jgi:DNA repair exonuclease SbcCD ATPase subunit
LDLQFKESQEISKLNLRKYLEKKIPGLKVDKFRSFKSSKSEVIAEVITNITQLLKAEKIGKGMSVIETKDKDVTEATLESFLEMLGHSLAKLDTEDELLDNFEKVNELVLDINKRMQKVIEENKHLKASLDVISQQPFISTKNEEIKVMQNKSESNVMEHTNNLIKTLKEENEKLQKELENAEDRIILYEKDMGAKALVNRINDLENQLRQKDSEFDVERADLQERIKTFSLEILYKTDLIRELQEGTSQQDIIKNKDEAEKLRASVNDLKEKLAKTNSELKKTTAQLLAAKDKESQLTTDLARALEDIEKLKDGCKSPSSEYKKMTYIPLSSMLTNEGESSKVELSRQEKNRMTYLLTQLAEKEEVITKFMCDLKVAQVKAMNMGRDAQVYLLQTETITKEKVELMREIEGLRRREIELKERITYLEQEVANKGTENKQLEQMVDSCNKTISSFKSKKNDQSLLIRLTEIEKLNKEYKEKLTNNEKDILKLVKVKQENEELNDQINELRKERANDLDRITLLESDNNNLKASLNAVQIEMQGVSDEVNEKNRTIDILKANLNGNTELSNVELERINEEKSETMKELIEANSRDFILRDNQGEITTLRDKNMELQNIINNQLQEEEIKRLNMNSNETSKDESLKEYIQEIVYLYKTIRNNAQERIEETKEKESKLLKLEEIQAAMSDRKTDKETLKNVVISSLIHFPYLSKMDLKTSYKFIVMAIFNIVEHKKEKLETYRQVKERYTMLMESSEPKYKIYTTKMQTLFSKK